ncbi:hypothetical protein MASR2M15_27470 [Anaerolineales bacterium]
MKYAVSSLLILCFLILGLPSIQAQSSCSNGGSQAPVELSVPNLTSQKLNVYWLDFQCNEQLTDVLVPGKIFYQSTYDGHEWIFRDDNGQEVTRFVTSSSSPMVMLDGSSFTPQAANNTCSSQGQGVANQDTKLKVINYTDDQLLLFWTDFNCVEWLYGVVPPQGKFSHNSYVAHDWVVRYIDGRLAGQATLVTQSNEIVIGQPSQGSAATATPASADDTAATFPVEESLCEVMSVTADMGVDPFYTKYCEYQGLRIMSSANVEDASLAQAWLIAANMFFNRADVVESMVEMNFFVALMSEEEVTTDIPELTYLMDDDSFNFDESREYSKVLEEPRLALIGEENLLCADDDINLGQNLLVGRLASLTRFVLVKDLDPDISEQLDAIRLDAIDKDLWSSSDWVTESNNNYWDYGVKTYFNSSFDGLLTGPTDNYTNTRVELADYDPQLYDLIDSVYQTEDWTPVCPS